MSYSRRYILALAFLVLAVSVFSLRRCILHPDYMENTCVPYVPGKALCVAVDLEPGVFEIDSSGGFSGRQYDLVKHLFADNQIDWFPFASRTHALKSLVQGQVSLYATSYPLTAANLPEGTISTHEIYVSGFALVHRKGEHYEKAIFGQDSIVRVHIPKGSPSIRMILEHVRELALSHLEIVEVDHATPISLILDVANRKIDYTMCDRGLAETVTATLPDLVCDHRISQDMYQVWLLNSQDTLLLKMINTRIDSLMRLDSGTVSDSVLPLSSLQIH